MYFSADNSMSVECEKEFNKTKITHIARKLQLKSTAVALQQLIGQ